MKVTTANPDYSILLVSTEKDGMVEDTAYIDLDTAISTTDLIFKAEYVYDGCSTFQTFSIPQATTVSERIESDKMAPWENFISDDYMICPSTSTNIVRRFFIPPHISHQFPALTIWNNETFERVESPKVLFRSPATYIIQFDPRNYRTPVSQYILFMNRLIRHLILPIESFLIHLATMPLMGLCGLRFLNICHSTTSKLTLDSQIARLNSMWLLIVHDLLNLLAIT